MRKFYNIAGFFLLAFTSTAQTLTIPDANFKAKLLAASPSNQIAKNINSAAMTIDANGDGEIQQSEALAVYKLDVTDLTNNTNNDDIYSLLGVEYFTNLTYLACAKHFISTLNISTLTNLNYLGCSSNNISSLDLTALNNLEILYCGSNDMTNLYVAGLENLEQLNCDRNLLSSLDLTGLSSLTNINMIINNFVTIDFSPLPNLHILECSSNPLIELDFSGISTLTNLTANNLQIEILDLSGQPGFNGGQAVDNPALHTIYLKNGGYDNFFFNNTNTSLSYICGDTVELSYLQTMADNANMDIIITSYCPLGSNGDFNTVQGKVTFDLEGNGCSTSDAPGQNIQIGINDGVQSGYTYTNEAGQYVLYVGQENVVVTPVIGNNELFTITPGSFEYNFTANNNEFVTADFCIEPNGANADLEVSILPIITAGPGFNAKYRITYTNNGNIAQSGNIIFQYQDALLDYISSVPSTLSQNPGTLTWEFSNLQPFDTNSIDVILNLNTPQEIPAVNNGDILSFTAIINAVSSPTDGTPEDNTAQFEQIVMGSFDPNDKQVTEGSAITTEQVSDYLHYFIRFQNTGTAPALNIVVKDMLSDNLNWESFMPITTSHPYRATLTGGNKAEFFFEGINLPAEQDDEPGSHGFIAFKIKPSAGFWVGDIIENTAEIYFDHNAPIVTNTVSTAVEVLGKPDFDFAEKFTLYPNPAHELITLHSETGLSASSVNIYNLLGQLVQTEIIPHTMTSPLINVSSLQAGTYLLEVVTHKGKSTQKIVKI